MARLTFTDDFKENVHQFQYFRWNSTYEMLERALELKDPLARVLSDRKGEKLRLNWQTLDVLEAVKIAMEPLAPLTDALSGSFSRLY